MTPVPAIVIAAYNRPHTLERLLRSVANAYYDAQNITLILSIDKSDSNEVLQLCEAFNWQHGEKRIIKHEENLGLKQHIISCCNLSQQYGSIIMLEDDLLVSPYYYAYAAQALKYYSTEKDIAGISLYSYAVTENGFLPFYPLADGKKQYFMQLPSSWGQAFTAQQWQAFMHWYNSEQNTAGSTVIPEYVKQWSAQSWKKHFVQYMTEQDKYFAFPKTSYTTNSGEPGVNTDRQGLYQVQLAQSMYSGSFVNKNESNAIYDAWFELMPTQMGHIAEQLKSYDFTVDLYGSKTLADIATPYLLSCKPCSKPILSFGNTLPDTIQNISLPNQGIFFSLGRTEDFSEAAIDPLNYYINLNPIKEVVVDEYISKKFNSYVADMKYRQTYPKVTFVILSANNERAITTIADSDYPADRVSINKIEHKQPLGTAYTDDGDKAYFVLLNGDEAVDKNLVREAIYIMEKYPDINWLTFTNQKSATLQRWNKHLFTLSIEKQHQRRINNGLTVLSKKAWEQIQDCSSAHINEIWGKLFDTEQLYTCVSESVNALDTNYELLEGNIYGKFWEQLMLKEVTYLRAYYKSKQGLPPVVRQTSKGGTYYLADY